MDKEYALIDENNIVVNCVIVSDENFIHISDILSSNNAVNAIEFSPANPAYIGGTWNGEYFIPPQPYNSWTLETIVYRQWVPPIPMPHEGGPYMWNEETLSWEHIEIIEPPSL